jgi:hypothetical protein
LFIVVAARRDAWVAEEGDKEVDKEDKDEDGGVFGGMAEVEADEADEFEPEVEAESREGGCSISFLQ